MSPSCLAPILACVWTPVSCNCVCQEFCVPSGRIWPFHARLLVFPVLILKLKIDLPSRGWWKGIQVLQDEF